MPVSGIALIVWPVRFRPRSIDPPLHTDKLRFQDFDYLEPALNE
jgi:hypothetical protein